MSTDDTGTTDPQSSPDGAALSRRGLLAAAGAVGVAATAATVIGVSTTSSTSRARSTASGSATANAGTAAHGDGPIVVHVRDLASGTLDVFEGTEHRQLRDPELAAQLAAAARS